MSTTNRVQEAQLEAILAHPSYRLAHEDQELLADADSRPIRLHSNCSSPSAICAATKFSRLWWCLAVRV
jgi:hypothetical protein